MKAEDLRLDELLTVADGSLSLHGRRLVLHSLHAMAQFRADLVGMAGPVRARRILTRFGYFWGQADAAAMKRVFSWPSQHEYLRAGARLMTLEGAAKAVVKSLELADGKPFKMELLWHASAESEEQLLELGGVEQPSCWILTGYASGYCSYCLSRPVYFIEQRCRAQGDRICTALGMEQAAWGERIKPHLEFFEPEDIQGKIQMLTAELQSKSRELAQKRKQLQTLERATASPAFAEVRSQSFQQVLDLATRVAPFESSVLITGESGVGKEVLARYIHENSARAKGPFMAINCGSLPESLLQSELFGHKEGAFTGAIHERMGIFEQARGGTMFLDEIGDITPGMQVSLLRVLQEREVRRVGENKPRHIDVRVMAATNRDLAAAVRAGTFREDLFYRLGVFEIRVPPLRERRDDILPLARYLAALLGARLNIKNLRLDARCFEYLQAYAWPGNVRELQNCIERAAVLSRNGLITPEELAPSVLSGSSSPGKPFGTLEEVERRHIEMVLAAAGGNRARAAKVLGISTTTLWRRLKELDLDRAKACSKPGSASDAAEER
jgi:two-component system, NtrC family, response regulator HydG